MMCVCEAHAAHVQHRWIALCVALCMEIFFWILALWIAALWITALLILAHDSVP